MEQNRIDISGFLETMDQMCQTMRGAEDNMANQFTLQSDEELDPQLEAMTSPTHYVAASQFRITHFSLRGKHFDSISLSTLCVIGHHRKIMTTIYLGEW